MMETQPPHDKLTQTPPRKQRKIGKRSAEPQIEGLPEPASHSVGMLTPRRRHTPEQLLKKHEGEWAAVELIEGSEDVYLLAVAPTPAALYWYFAENAQQYPNVSFRKVMSEPGRVERAVVF